MKKVSQSDRTVNELVNHLKDLTEELNSLHSELYWLAMQGQEASGRFHAAELNVELLTQFKGAMDNVRLLLWDYIASASQVDQQEVQEGMETERLRRMSRFLQILRERLGRGHDQQPVSFIEKVSAAMKKRFSDKVA
jgi:septal ring factor EnvC (AmiA/AmiB activator)